jgi:hypothetical protein
MFLRNVCSHKMCRALSYPGRHHCSTSVNVHTSLYLNSRYVFLPKWPPTTYVLKGTANPRLYNNCPRHLLMMATCCSYASVRFMVLLISMLSLIGCMAVVEVFVYLGAAGGPPNCVLLLQQKQTLPRLSHKESKKNQQVNKIINQTRAC